jgi:hypothetical protein
MRCVCASHSEATGTHTEIAFPRPDAECGPRGGGVTCGAKSRPGRWSEAGGPVFQKGAVALQAVRMVVRVHSRQANSPFRMRVFTMDR